MSTSQPIYKPGDAGHFRPIMNRGPLVVVVGPLPPPMHGAARNTQFIADLIRSHLQTVVINVAPIATRSRLLYHLSRVHRVLAACGRLVAFRSYAPKLMYICADAGPGMFYTCVFIGLARCLGYDLAVHHRSFAYLDRPKKRMRLLSRLAGRGAIHICLCSRMAETLAARYPVISHVAVLSNAALHQVAAALPQRKDTQRLVLGHLSNLSESKGLNDVLRVFRAGLERGLDLELVLAGPVETQADRELIASYLREFPTAVRWLGPTYGDAKSDFYSSIDVFLFPTRYIHEAEPNVVYEALCHGRPVIAYDRGCISDQVMAGAGLVVPPSESFAEAALALLSRWHADPNALAEASVAAYMAHRAAHNYAKTQLDAFLDLLQRRIAAP